MIDHPVNSQRENTECTDVAEIVDLLFRNLMMSSVSDISRVKYCYIRLFLLCAKEITQVQHVHIGLTDDLIVWKFALKLKLS